MNSSPEIRIDKWLWAVRIYKTRTLATDACRAGHVKIGGESVKPSRTVRLHDVITAQVGQIQRTVKVLGFIEQRVGAQVAKEFAEDQTPESEFQKRREKFFDVVPFQRGRSERRHR